MASKSDMARRQLERERMFKAREDAMALLHKANREAEAAQVKQIAGIASFKLDGEAAKVGWSTQVFTPGSGAPIKIGMTVNAKEYMQARPAGEEVPIDTLLEACGARILSRMNVDKLLARWGQNRKLGVDVSKGTVVFVPTYNVKDRGELLAKLKEFHDEGHGGMSLEQLRESYVGVESDVDKLLEEGFVVQLKKEVRRKTEVGDRIIFYKDKSCEVKPVDKEFRSMFYTFDSANIKEYIKEHNLPKFQDPKPKEGKRKKRKRPR